MSHAASGCVFMTIPESVPRVPQAAARVQAGEISMLDMGEPVIVLDMAERLIILLGC